ncbi:hypothetical protein RHDC4_03126 [Rhodocyclaceae bacterium]|nr:hypothetical protein RHDC4_03126 [Rhodocyclaceae bacterium]
MSQSTEVIANPSLSGIGAPQVADARGNDRRAAWRSGVASDGGRKPMAPQADTGETD